MGILRSASCTYTIPSAERKNAEKKTGSTVSESPFSCACDSVWPKLEGARDDVGEDEQRRAVA